MRSRNVNPVDRAVRHTGQNDGVRLHPQSGVAPHLPIEIRRATQVPETKPGAAKVGRSCPTYLYIRQVPQDSRSKPLEKACFRQEKLCVFIDEDQNQKPRRPVCSRPEGMHPGVYRPLPCPCGAFLQPAGTFHGMLTGTKAGSRGADAEEAEDDAPDSGRPLSAPGQASAGVFRASSRRSGAFWGRSGAP